MKKKILALCLVVVLAVTAVTGATLAYFTDADADRNVMTLGNVLIVQNETDREGDAYEDDQGLFPAVPGEEGLKKDSTVKDTDGESDVAIWDGSIKNEIDKFVSVTNGGTEKAYVRTILAFETKRSYEIDSKDKWTDLHDHFFLINGDFDYLEGDEENNRVIDAATGDTAFNFMYVTINDVEYVLAVKVYDEALEPGKTTTASLRQFALTWDAGNDVYDFFGDRYDIFALSQAVQVEGFEDAETALNTAFGKITPEKFVEWLAETPIKTTGPNNVIPTF